MVFAKPFKIFALCVKVNPDIKKEFFLQEKNVFFLYFLKSRHDFLIYYVFVFHAAGWSGNLQGDDECI